MIGTGFGLEINRIAVYERRTVYSGYPSTGTAGPGADAPRSDLRLAAMIPHRTYGTTTAKFSSYDTGVRRVISDDQIIYGLT